MNYNHKNSFFKYSSTFKSNTNLQLKDPNPFYAQKWVSVFKERPKDGIDTFTYKSDTSSKSIWGTSNTYHTITLSYKFVLGRGEMSNFGIFSFLGKISIHKLHSPLGLDKYGIFKILFSIGFYYYYLHYLSKNHLSISISVSPINSSLFNGS